MEIKTLGSTTMLGRALNQETIMDFSGRMAGICYQKESLDTILTEPTSSTIERATVALEKGRHREFGHACVTLYLEGVPKILAMILNNERVYNTSENYVHHSIPVAQDLELELYLKWKDAFLNRIVATYPDMDSKLALRYAQEHATYLISVFSPSTNMAYTTSVRQLNYLVGWMEKFVGMSAEQRGLPREFSNRLAEIFVEFMNKIDKNLLLPGLNDTKNRGFSLFAKRIRETEWGENYCVTYYGSLAQLALAQRYRTLLYEFSFMNLEDIAEAGTQFYIPPILRDDKKLQELWLRDAESLEGNFPQGTLVRITERGTVDNFVMKCAEQLCGQAPIDVCTQTALTLYKYYWSTIGKDSVQEELAPYVNSPRCRTREIECKNPCYFGSENIFTRLV